MEFKKIYFFHYILKHILLNQILAFLLYLTPLYFATVKRNVEMVKLLLSSKTINIDIGKNRCNIISI